MMQVRRVPMIATAVAFVALTCGCQAILDAWNATVGGGGDDNGGSGGRQTRVELAVDSSVTTVGTGSCLAALPFPQSCYTQPHGGVACTVGSDGPKATGTGMMIHANGCVGSLRVLEAGEVPDFDGASAWAAPYRVDGGSSQCCAEHLPSNKIAHITSFDPKSRAFFIRTAEPVTGPTQVAMVANSYFWRFYVGAVPPAGF
jgi:hypothetical protein